MLPHLRTGWAVDQAILNEENKVVVVRFGHDENETCMQMDEVLYKISEVRQTTHPPTHPPNPLYSSSFSPPRPPLTNQKPTHPTHPHSPTQDVRNFASIYLVDTTEVPDFNVMYELYDDCTCMFFFRNKHIMIDLVRPTHPPTHPSNNIHAPCMNSSQSPTPFQQLSQTASFSPTHPPTSFSRAPVTTTRSTS